MSAVLNRCATCLALITVLAGVVMIGVLTLTLAFGQPVVEIIDQIVSEVKLILDRFLVLLCELEPRLGLVQTFLE